MIRSSHWLSILLLLTICTACSGSPVVLSGVPSYNWYHGCGPTAVASIFGYWDLNGYSNLFTASGNDVYLTSNVQDQISSPEHNAKYDPHPDDPTLPTPEYTSIADWFQTSVGIDYGWSFLSYSDDAFIGYAAYRGYTFNSYFEAYSPSYSWLHLTKEINSGRPVLFLVDTDGDGSTDHFVPVFGYDVRGSRSFWYACYTTWHENETIDWYEFRPMNNAWGVGYMTFAIPEPIPEPSALLVLVCGMGSLIGLKRKLNK